MKTKNLDVFLFFLVIVLLTVVVALILQNTKIRCSNFANQQEATQYMNIKGTTYLDRNNDGIACNGLPKGGGIYGKHI